MAKKMPSQSRTKDNIWLGAFYMAFAMFFFGIGNGIVKEASQECSVMQIIFFRSLWALLALTAYMLFTGKTYLIKTKKLPQQLTRGIIGFISLCGMFYSFDVLPLTDGTALAFAAPLFITALSYPVLKERIELKMWIAIFVGFAGVSIMANPSGKVTLIGIGAGLLSAFLEGLIALLARKLSSTEDPITTTFYHTLALAVLAGAVSPLFWHSVNSTNFMLLAVLGFLSAIGQVLMVSSYTIAPAAVVAPLYYTLMVWAAILGYLRWNEDFRINLLIGAPIVIVSGIYIIARESRLKKSISQR